MIAKLEQRQLQDYLDYVRRVTTIHNETVQRLVNCEGTDPLELAELFEDVANRYLDISEKIRAHSISKDRAEQHASAPQAVSTLSVIRTAEEVTED